MSEDTELPKGADGEVAADPTFSPLRCEKLVTFAGGTTDAWGDDAGALDGGILFTVTGTVRVRIIGIVETSLVGAATINVGVTGGVATLIAQCANATGMDVGEIWHDADVDAMVEASTVMDEKIISNGLDIRLYNGTADITAGAIRFLVSWYPISKDGRVIPSSN